MSYKYETKADFIIQKYTRQGMLGLIADTAADLHSVST
jgi:hypothetical protein